MIGQRLFVACAIWSLVAVTYGQDLRKAVREGDVDLVKSILDSGFDPNVAYENRFTSIYFAEDPKIVDLLIKHGAVLNIRVMGQSPLENVAARAFYNPKTSEKTKVIIQKLRDAGAEYTFDAAVYLDDTDFVKSSLSMDSAWVKDRKGSDALRLAASTGRVDICKLLFDHNADPNSFERGHGLPIIKDAVKYPAVVKLLIERGVNLKRRLTFQGGSSGTILVWSEATVLHYAVQAGNLDSVKLLIEAGVDPNATDSHGNTPLHVAIAAENLYRLHGFPFHPKPKRFVPIVKYLLDHEASLILEDKQRRTVSDLARELSIPNELPQLVQQSFTSLAESKPRIELSYHTRMMLLELTNEITGPNNLIWLIEKKRDEGIARYQEDWKERFRRQPDPAP